MKIKIIALVLSVAAFLCAEKADAQTSQVSLADVLAPGWQDHRNHTLILRNNGAEHMTAVIAVKTYRTVPNTLSFVSKGTPIYMIVGADALIHETRIERVVVPRHGEKKVSYLAFGVSLIGEEPVKKPSRRK